MRAAKPLCTHCTPQAIQLEYQRVVQPPTLEVATRPLMRSQQEASDSRSACTTSSACAAQYTVPAGLSLRLV